MDRLTLARRLRFPHRELGQALDEASREFRLNLLVSLKRPEASYEGHILAGLPHPLLRPFHRL